MKKDKINEVTKMWKAVNSPIPTAEKSALLSKISDLINCQLPAKRSSLDPTIDMCNFILKNYKLGLLSNPKYIDPLPESLLFFHLAIQSSDLPD